MQGRWRWVFGSKPVFHSNEDALNCEVKRAEPVTSDLTIAMNKVNNGEVEFSRGFWRENGKSNSIFTSIMFPVRQHRVLGVGTGTPEVRARGPATLDVSDNL